MTEGTLVWNGGTAEANNQFEAWYPATAAYDSFTITDQSTSDAISANDWMTATTEAMTKQETLPLNFNHRLTKVTVTVNNDAWGNEVAEADRSLTAAQIYTPTVVTWDGTNTTGTDNNWISACVAEGGLSFTAIICPGTAATDESGYWIQVTAGGKTFNVKPNSTALEAGKHYAFTLTVGKDLTAVTGVGVNDWGSTTVSTAPNADEDTSNIIDAVNKITEADDMYASVAKALAVGHTSLEITMTAEPTTEMCNAIRAALYDAFGAGSVTISSIDLTLKDVTKVPANAFYYEDNDGAYPCYALKSVNLPAVTEIGDKAFYGSMFMTSVSAQKATEIGNQAFFGAASIKEVSLPAVTEIGNEAFGGCDLLTTVSLPKVTTIGYYAFYNCLSLTTVTFGALESVQMDPNNGTTGIFYGCTSESIALTLSANQKVMTYVEDTKCYTVAEGASLYSASDDCKSNSFIGYTFKSIAFASEGTTDAE